VLYKTYATMSRSLAAYFCFSNRAPGNHRDIATEHPALADDVFDRFKFTCQDDKEARLFTPTDEPLARPEVNVGSTSRQAPLFLFFDACKERNVFKFCGSNHWLFFAYRRLGLRT